MPRPVDAKSRYLPGLDGVRALAVIAVVAYHLGIPGWGGGLLGVGVFFTLSGFLITSILLREWEKNGKINLPRFWLRRMRRLLPAVIVVLAAVLLATHFATPDEMGTRKNEALAGLFYVANWHDIASGVSYFTSESPLSHLWSLAIEEQFYVVWPPLVLGLLAWGVRRRQQDERRGVFFPLGMATVALIIVSTVVMALLYRTPDLAFDTNPNTRAYEGTDTRAAALLIGALLAYAWNPSRLRTRIPTSGKLVIDGLGLVGLAGIAAFIAMTNENSPFLYEGGQVLLSFAVVLLVAAVVHPASVLAKVFGVAPMRWVGERSYGIYLWHVPVMAFTPDTALEGQPIIKGILQVLVTLAISAASWRWVEDPIRRHGLIGAMRSSGWAVGIPRMATALLATTAVGVAAMTGAHALGSSTDAADGNLQGDVAAGPIDLSTKGDDPKPTKTSKPGKTPKPTGAPTTTGAPTAEPTTSAPTTPAGDPMTRCTEVIHIGESTSLYFLDPAVLKEEDQIDSQYARYGVTKLIPDISGARSIVERWKGQPNAEDAVKKHIGQGYKGCWVLAMGTNDPANVSVSDAVPLDKRIDIIMQHIPEDSPVLWTTTRTLLSKGHYAQKNMEAWTAALERACTRYPNMRAYDWASEVKDDWYINDGIHPDSGGYKERSHRLARSLAVAFPKDGDSPSSCLVGSGL